MATDLIELTADIVISHVSVTEMSLDELLTEIKSVYATLEGLQTGEIEVLSQEPGKRGRKPKEMVGTITEEKPAVPPAPVMTIHPRSAIAAAKRRAHR